MQKIFRTIEVEVSTVNGLDLKSDKKVIDACEKYYVGYNVLEEGWRGTYSNMFKMKEEHLLDLLIDLDGVSDDRIIVNYEGELESGIPHLSLTIYDDYIE